MYKEILITLMSCIFMIGQVHAANLKAQTPFNYKDADISTVASELSRRMGKTFVIDPQVRGKVTILTSHPMTNEQAYDAFLISLAMEGLTTIEQGPFTRIAAAQSSQRSNCEVVTELPDIKHERMLTMIFKPKFLSAKQIFNELGPILQSRLGEMRILEERNLLIATDYVSNLYRIKNIIDQVDVTVEKK